MVVSATRTLAFPLHGKGSWFAGAGQLLLLLHPQRLNTAISASSGSQNNCKQPKLPCCSKLTPLNNPESAAALTLEHGHQCVLW
jgi:hypothetical protein